MAVLLGSIYNNRLKKLNRKNFVYDKQTDSFIDKDIAFFPAHLKRQFGVSRYFIKRANKQTFNEFLKNKNIL